MLGLTLGLLLAVAPPPGDDEAAGPLVPVTDQAGPVAAATERLQTPRFTLVFTPRAEGAARYLAGQIEGLRDEVAQAVGRDWPGVTEVRLGFGRAEYEALALPGGRPPSWAVALAYPEHDVVLVEAHSLIQGDGQQTLRHELVHVALGQLGHGWPHWWQEGLAMELTGERKFRLSQYAVLSRAVTQDRVFWFDQLKDGFPKYPEDVEVAYAQSAAFLDFLVERHGRAPFGVVIDRVRGGDPFETAFAVAFHTSLSVEERAFRAMLPRVYPWWPLVLSGGGLVWGASSILLVVAYARRRRQVAAFRAEQARVEQLEDLGDALVERRGLAVNDDAELALPWVDVDWGPWVVYSVRSGPGKAPGRSSFVARGPVKEAAPPPATPRTPAER